MVCTFIFVVRRGAARPGLALHVAQLLGRPVVLINGDDEMGTADLVGKESGYKRSYTRDDYIHTVLKVEEEMKPMWVGRALTEACQTGCTVVYDEFTRSRPEANNVLLSVLEERVLPLRGKSIPVHPNFRIIFTSNPAEYAGVHAPKMPCWTGWSRSLCKVSTRRPRQRSRTNALDYLWRRSNASSPLSEHSAMRDSRPAAPASARPS